MQQQRHWSVSIQGCMALICLVIFPGYFFLIQEHWTYSGFQCFPFHVCKTSYKNKT